MQHARGKTSRVAGIILAGILLIGPLFFLQQMLTELAVKDETHLSILAREKLVNEMEGFQDSLQPDKYIEKALAALNRRFELKGAAERDRELLFAPGIDPKLIDERFIASARNFLENEYQIRPFLMLAADCDLQHHWIWSATKLFPDDATRDRFAEAAMYGMTFVTADPKNFLPDSPNLTMQKSAFILKNLSIDSNPHQIFAKMFRDHISIFSNPPLYQNRAQTFFQTVSAISGLISSSFLLIGGFRQTRICSGFITAASTVAICHLRLCSETPCVAAIRVPNVICFAGRCSSLFFTKKMAGFFIYQAFQMFFILQSKTMELKNPATRLKVLDFLQQHCLVTSTDAALLRSGYRQAIALAGAFIKIILLLILALAVRLLPGSAVFKIRLGGKLRLAVALAVMLPVAGVMVVSMLTRNNSEQLAIHNCQTRVKQHLQLLEKIVSENDPRVVLIFQEFKKYFADRYDGVPLSNKFTANMTDTYLLLQFANMSLFIDGNARMLKFNNQRACETNINEMSGLLRILSELDAVNLSNKIIQDIQRKNLFLSTFIDSYWDVFATGPILARESLPVKNFLSVSLLLRACNQLIARPATPNKPEAILFQEISDTAVMRSLLKQLWHRSPELLTDYSENHQIDFGMFLRGPLSLREMQIPRIGPSTTALKSLAEKAIERRTSGSSVSHEGEKIVINSWLYYDDTPIIITSRATIPAIPLQTPFYYLLPLALFAYAFLAMGLLSGTLADALLVPVQTLLSFVRSIQNNQLNVRAEIKSGDEFADLAESFNRMSTGLCQREKMRRFVSEKLYQSLENTRPEKSAGQTMVTILSSDIRGFTTISEKYPPEEIVSLLNDYFTAMETALTSHGGSIEKIVGDAIIAAFYSDASGESHAIRACKAALSMRNQLDVFNAERSAGGQFTIDSGIGLASGRAVLGFAGTTGHREFFLIGDVIQRAEQLESLTRHGTASRIFADRTTFDLSGHAVSFVSGVQTEPEVFYREVANG